ncbi:diacylglycerol/lipid kinase family protein [Saccharicrinis sp. FJH54]|uniref:diacylglycerol/lipid kinase family protein n=1 Tax=Saccharicrinis sp. FJH54 TaxID=3344665 RepID=UPI0035D4A4D5
MPKNNDTDHSTILFVINPVSGDTDKAELEERIERLSVAKNIKCDLFYTTGKDDEERLKERLKTCNPDKVVSVGGDGTCNLTARVLLHSDIQLGIIPLGSANGLAKELELPVDLDESLDIVTGNQIKTIDVLKINNHISLHLSDIGVNAEVVNRFEKDNVRGLAGYARHFFLELFRAKPHHFLIESGDKKINRKAYMVAIANASKYGTGAVINPKGKLDDGWFEVILIRPYKLVHLLQMIIPFFTHELDQLDYVEIYSFKKATISNKNKRVLQIDGEIIGQQEKVNVEILPQCIKVLIPENKKAQ